jgi:hypothetical protein
MCLCFRPCNFEAYSDEILVRTYESRRSSGRASEDDVTANEESARNHPSRKASGRKTRISSVEVL